MKNRLRFITTLPKKKTIQVIEKIIEPYRTNPGYSMNPKYILQNNTEIIGDIDGDFFWIQEVTLGKPSNVIAFYGIIFDNEKNTKIEGEFKIIPETRIMMGYLSLLFTIILAFFKYINVFSFMNFLVLFCIIQVMILGIIGLMFLGSMSYKKRIIEILDNLDNSYKLSQLISKPIL